jgi:outer membrane protein, multidrug efflux system
LRGAQLRITVSKSNADIQEKSYKATQQLLNTGSATRLDVSRAKAQLDTTRASIVARQADYDFALFRLAVLVGETPTAFKARFKINDEMPTLPILIPSRMPGEVLRARPDIMVAEKRLARETALIGVALGDLYPRLTLGATAGTSAVDASDLGSEASLGFRYGPNLRWAGLDLARLKSRVSAQESRTQGAIFAFEQTVLLALEETESALAAYGYELKQMEFLSSAVQSSEEAVKFANERLAGGVTNNFEVLDAERSLLQAQDTFSASRTRALIRLVQIYRAFGGDMQVPSTPAPKTTLISKKANK